MATIKNEILGSNVGLFINFRLCSLERKIQVNSSEIKILNIRNINLRIFM